MMLKKKKIFIGVLGASVLLIAGSNLAINYMIDRQKINDQLSEIIEKKNRTKSPFKSFVSTIGSLA